MRLESVLFSKVSLKVSSRKLLIYYRRLALYQALGHLGHLGHIAR
jgi:hypothetical protein